MMMMMMMMMMMIQFPTDQLSGCYFKYMNLHLIYFDGKNSRQIYHRPMDLKFNVSLNGLRLHCYIKIRPPIPSMGLIYLPLWMVDFYGELSRQILPYPWMLWGYYHHYINYELSPIGFHMVLPWSWNQEPAFTGNFLFFFRW